MLNEINDIYFQWLFDLVCRRRYAKPIYRKLLTRLHHTEFVYVMPRDRNRAEDGEELRYRFALANGYDVRTTMADLASPCSVLEMIMALAIRFEETFMDDPSYGDRMSQWFWNMIVNLGLGPMTNDMYDEACVSTTIQRFLDRDYSPDGRGGLFHIRDCPVDLRDVEIWVQACWYADSILDTTL